MTNQQHTNLPVKMTLSKVVTTMAANFPPVARDVVVSLFQIEFERKADEVWR